MAATEISSSFVQGKMPSKSSGAPKKLLSESGQPSSATTHGSSTSRPSSNYGGRSQQIIGPQKGSWNEYCIDQCCFVTFLCIGHC